MSEYSIRETFFRPDQPAARAQTRIPAPLFNGLRLLLTRNGGRAVFVPIRSMQYQAVVDHEEILFIDSHGGYAYHDGEGGRLIRIAWRPAVRRDSLSAPVDCEIVYYFEGLAETQIRLLGEIQPVIRELLRRQAGPAAASLPPRVLPVGRPR